MSPPTSGANPRGPAYAGRASPRPSPPLTLESESGSVRQRIAAATHHGGDEIAAQPRPRYFKMAPTALIRRNQRTSSDPWLAEQPVMHGRRRSVLASESRAYRRLSARSSTAVDDAALQDGWQGSQATRRSREATLFSAIRTVAKATRF